VSPSQKTPFGSSGG